VRHQFGEMGVHFLGAHLDLALRERREAASLTQCAKTQAIHQGPSVYGHVHRGNDVQLQNNTGDLTGDSGIQLALVRLVGFVGSVEVVSASA